MKRSTKNKPDIDTNGRVRRHPPAEGATQPVLSKFIDGPLAGCEMMVPRGTTFFRIGSPLPLFMYSFAGREGKTPLFAVCPKERPLKKVLMFSIGKYGRDPRAVHAASRPKPMKRTEPSKCGQGARRRATKRGAVNATP